MSYKTFAIILISVLFSVVSICQENIKELEGVLEQKPDDIETLIKLGKVYHDQGAAGDEEAVENGFTCLDKALKIDPSNAVAMAYRGSLWTIRGRDAWSPFEKLKHVNKGIDEIDKAVDLAPDNISIRLMRGIGSVQLPTLFKRLGTAIKDFSFLLADPRFPHLDSHLQSTIYYWAGIAYKNDNQMEKAKENFEKSISAEPESDIAKKAKEELS